LPTASIVVLSPELGEHITAIMTHSLAQTSSETCSPITAVMSSGSEMFIVIMRSLLQPYPEMTTLAESELPRAISALCRPA